MPLKWISSLPVAPAPRPLEAPITVLAAPGTAAAPDSPAARRLLFQALMAGSLAVVAFKPYQAALPRPAASTFNVTNLQGSGSGSLRAAIDSANSNPGLDMVTFSPGLTGTIPITSQLTISDSIQIVGPGPGALAVSGSNLTRVFYLYTPNSTIFTTTISGLTIRDGFEIKAGGGGIVDYGQPLVLDHVAILSNTTTNRGGGVYLDSNNHLNAGALLMTNSVISGNVAADSGGGLALYEQVGNVIIQDSTIANNISGAYGGGLAFGESSGGQPLITRSTLVGNTAEHGGGVSFYGTSDPAVIENSTVSGNHATNQGGGVFLYDNEPVTIFNSTIVSNTAVSSGGGIWEGNTVPITDTIIAGNSAASNADLRGDFELSYDLVQVTGTANITDQGGNLFGLNPLLGVLANNGGPTQTHLPLTGSPVINAGDPAFVSPPATDQRGAARVVNGRIDIGAVELNPGTLQFTTSLFQIVEHNITATVTVSRTGGSDGLAAVDYSALGGTATQGVDYQAASGTLHWANGESATKSFQVIINDDSQVEANETIGLTLSNAQGAALGLHTGTLTILNDDSYKLFLPLVQR